MGNREDLLEGARRCLLEKGFARTTARDIARASGANLASIGYHYGSKDALLAEAYVALVGDQSESFDPAADVASTAPGSPERFRAVWSNVVATMGKPDSIWHLSIEVIAMGDSIPAVREHLAVAQREGGRGLVSMLHDIPEPEVTDEQIDTLGQLYMCLMSGLIVQHTFDPESAPSGERLTEGLLRVTAGFGDAGPRG
ncbi:TetR/AcrR family transcriptional regulator [Streptomyces sp. NPDC090306]|uniref:TetR/AcrR family transcriptional regulator n=1 Tax=Streptomyces sp. NPDC090306 TaxID=3365961 RepID=UPI0038300676